MPTKKVLSKKVTDDVIPNEKATTALANLLSDKSSMKSKKKHEPTMLDQIMSGKIKKQENSQRKLDLSSTIIVHLAKIFHFSFNFSLLF